MYNFIQSHIFNNTPFNFFPDGVARGSLRKSVDCSGDHQGMVFVYPTYKNTHLAALCFFFVLIVLTAMGCVSKTKCFVTKDTTRMHTHTRDVTVCTSAKLK